ncbi:MAG: type II toxin-antitoxin system RelE/ParE family toxin [Campylobacterota bacterium]|nr:type II toxin-antitoxin system RelE/ParE family toxin [Campylobacterota bacterium]
MAYRLLFDDKVFKDLKNIDKSWQKKILEAIKTKLINNPHIGKKLVGDLSPYYRYRVNDYRVIYEIKEDEVVIIIVKIKHRKDVYR